MGVDLFAHAIRAGLAQRKLTSIINVLFVSNHSMAPTHDRKSIYLEDVFGEEGANEIEWKIGESDYLSPGMLLKPYKSSQLSAGLRVWKGTST